MKEKTEAEKHREEEAKKEAIKELDWWTLAQIRQMEKEYLRLQQRDSK